MIYIPPQLRQQQFRFFLAGTGIKWGKHPIEKGWNTAKNYTWYDDRLQDHIQSGKNYGVVTGYGNLIIIDFDDKDYYDSKKDLLPETFTVQTACKRLFHKYYILKGKRIKKIGIDINEKRVCDIQSNGTGIIGATSKIGKNYYDISVDKSIATISFKQLNEIFELDLINQKKKNYEAKTKLMMEKGKVYPEKISKTIRELQSMGLAQKRDRHFNCPLHESQGGDCLHVMDNGSIFCFHCQSWFSNVNHLLEGVLLK